MVEKNTNGNGVVEEMTDRNAIECLPAHAGREENGLSRELLDAAQELEIVSTEQKRSVDCVALPK